MAYQTVYDLQSSGFHLWPYISLCVLIAFISLAWMAQARLKGTNPVWARGLFVCALLVADIFIAMPYLDYSRLSSALSSGDARVVDGYLTHHEVKPRMQFASFAGASQTFRVDGVSFDWVSPALQLPTSKGRFELHEGQVLRVTYIEDGAGRLTQRRILRMEVAEGAEQSSLATL